MQSFLSFFCLSNKSLSHKWVESILGQFWMILSPNKLWQNLFPLLSKALWSRINSCYSILFSNLKQKRTHIIIIRGIYSNMGLMFTETPYIR